MNIHDQRFLLSEQNALKKLLSQTSSGNVIGRMSLETRLRRVEEELKACEGLSPGWVNARLTFWGRPVASGRGIEADFGGDAIKAFSDAVFLVGASLHKASASEGPVPTRDDSRLLITGTVPGSFGFQVEDLTQQPGPVGESLPVEPAIERIKEIMKASVGTDEQLADALIETDQRALNSVCAFLKKTADSKAACALESGGDEFRFRDTAQVRRSENRLRESNIREDDVTLVGRFEGFLPKSRRAEFLILETGAEFLNEAIGTVVTSEVAPTVDDTVAIKDILNQPVRINARTKRVGQARPRYIITRCEIVP